MELCSKWAGVKGQIWPWNIVLTPDISSPMVCSLRTACPSPCVGQSQHSPLGKGIFPGMRNTQICVSEIAGAGLVGPGPWYWLLEEGLHSVVPRQPPSLIATSFCPPIHACSNLPCPVMQPQQLTIVGSLLVFCLHMWGHFGLNASMLAACYEPARCYQGVHNGYIVLPTVSTLLLEAGLGLGFMQLSSRVWVCIQNTKLTECPPDRLGMFAHSLVSFNFWKSCKGKDQVIHLLSLAEKNGLDAVTKTQPKDNGKEPAAATNY